MINVCHLAYSRAVSLNQVHRVKLDERTGHAFIVNYGGTVRAPAAWWERDVQRLHHWLPWLPQPFASTHLEPGSVSVLDTARL